MRKKELLLILLSLVGCVLNIGALKPNLTFGELEEKTGSSYNISNIDDDSDAERKRLQKDSILQNRKCNFFNYNADTQLNERFKLSYGSEFYPIDSMKMKLNVSFAFVIDKVTNDTTMVKMKNHRYALLSHVPLVIADVFEVEHDGHKYVIHELYDARTYFNSKEEKFQPLRDCYQIR